MAIYRHPIVLVALFALWGITLTSRVWAQAPPVADEGKPGISEIFGVFKPRLEEFLTTNRHRNPDQETYHFAVLLNTANTDGVAAQEMRRIYHDLLYHYLLESKEGSDKVSFVPFQLQIRSEEARWNRPFLRDSAQQLYGVPDSPMNSPDMKGGNDVEAALIQTANQIQRTSPADFDSTLFIVLSDSEVSQQPLKLDGSRADYVLAKDQKDFTAQFDKTGLDPNAQRGLATLKRQRPDATPVDVPVYWRLYTSKNFRSLATLPTIHRKNQKSESAAYTVTGPASISLGHLGRFKLSQVGTTKTDTSVMVSGGTGKLSFPTTLPAGTDSSTTFTYTPLESEVGSSVTLTFANSGGLTDPAPLIVAVRGAPHKEEPKDMTLPYIIGASLLLVAICIGYLIWLNKPRQVRVQYITQSDMDWKETSKVTLKFGQPRVFSGTSNAGEIAIPGLPDTIQAATLSVSLTGSVEFKSEAWNVPDSPVFIGNEPVETRIEPMGGSNVPGSDEIKLRIQRVSA